MLRELFDGFELELHMLADKLESARAAVERCESREEVASARTRVTAAENLLADVTAARNAVLAAEGRAPVLVEKFTKWRECVARCAELKQRTELLFPAIEKTRDTADIAQQKFDAALSRLAEHDGRLLKDSDFPTSRELAAESKRGAVLEAAVDAAKATRDQLLQEARDAEGRWRTAMREFDKALFDERMGRLPQPQKEQGVGLLLPVR